MKCVSSAAAFKVYDLKIKLISFRIYTLMCQDARENYFGKQTDLDKNQSQ